MRILVIDNYDSFVFNLVQYLGQLGAECEVRRNDEISVADVGSFGAAGILLSPGPGEPTRFTFLGECGLPLDQQSTQVRVRRLDLQGALERLDGGLM